MRKLVIALGLLCSSFPALADDRAPATKIPATATCPAGQRSAPVYDNACPEEPKKTCWVLTIICIQDKPK